MKKPQRDPEGSTRTRNQLRIIGGRWRGRKLAFPSLEGLRPTPDRVRETLFNWLAPDLPGAHCLDLFAGSGALGLEALSRGAASVTFIDSAGAATRQLQLNLEVLGCKDARVIQQPASDWLATARDDPYDVVFLDPPFGMGLAEPAIALLDQHQLLSPGGMVYLETGSEELPPRVPPNWFCHREKQAGRVCYRLYKTEGPG